MNALRLVEHWDAVLPVDGVGIKNQLCVYGLCVIENNHPIATHNDKFLLLVGIKPANKDMSANARRKFEVRHGDIGNAGMEKTVADGIDVRRFLTD